MRYEIKVQKSDETIAAVRSLILPDLKTAWSEVVDIAHDFGDIGDRIIVTDDGGEMVILVGVACACCLLSAPKSSDPTLTLQNIPVR